jgi:filamentous hemagglutinin
MRAPYAVDTRARIIQLENDRIFVRVYGEQTLGRWMMRPKEIQGLTPKQIQEKFALPELPTYISEVHLPKGSYLQIGTTASQVGWGSGGAIQYQALDWLNKNMFQNTRIFTPIVNHSRNISLLESTLRP